MTNATYQDLERLYEDLGAVINENLRDKMPPLGHIADARAAVRQTIDMRTLNEPGRLELIAERLADARAALEQNCYPTSTFDAAVNPQPRIDAELEAAIDLLVSRGYSVTPPHDGPLTSDSPALPPPPPIDPAIAGAGPSDPAAPSSENAQNAASGPADSAEPPTPEDSAMSNLATALSGGVQTPVEGLAPAQDAQPVEGLDPNAPQPPTTDLGAGPELVGEQQTGDGTEV